ncbi:MAG: hypothetical protein HC837_09090 [Chloroflexaceae bacterium]|nr:hypothetical protein [Chloroflexaceae bacterium]
MKYVTRLQSIGNALSFPYPLLRTIVCGMLLLVFLSNCGGQTTSTVESTDEGFPTTAAEPVAPTTEAEDAEPTEIGDATATPEPESETPTTDTDDTETAEPTERVAQPSATVDSNAAESTEVAAATEVADVSAETPGAAEPTEPAAEEPTVPPAPEAAATAEPTPVPAEPVAQKNGTFTFVDNLHFANGVATIYQSSNGSQFLRFESFEVSDGPGIYVLLSQHPQPRNEAEVFGDTHVDLGELTALSGNQNYDIPPGTDISQYQSVVLYCEPYAQVMSSAQLFEAQP